MFLNATWCGGVIGLTEIHSLTSHLFSSAFVLRGPGSFLLSDFYRASSAFGQKQQYLNQKKFVVFCSTAYPMQTKAKLCYCNLFTLLPLCSCCIQTLFNVRRYIASVFLRTLRQRTPALVIPLWQVHSSRCPPTLVCTA